MEVRPTLLCLLVSALGGGCNQAQPLDEATADTLLNEKFGERELFCRADIGISGGLARRRAGEMLHVSDCLWNLQRLGLLQVNCLQDATNQYSSPCGGLKVDLVAGRSRVTSETLEISCGASVVRVASIEWAGDVSWLSYESRFRIAENVRNGTESCRLVPGELPARGTVVARWRHGQWQVD